MYMLQKIGLSYVLIYMALAQRLVRRLKYSMYQNLTIIKLVSISNEK